MTRRKPRIPSVALGDMPEGGRCVVAACPDLALTVHAHGPMGTVVTLVRPGERPDRTILSNATEVRCTPS